MGCWNETCMVTQVPIRAGDPVVLIMLTKVGSNTANHAGFCNTNDIWTPKFLPVFGEYDDYGGLDKIQSDWNTQFIVDQLRDELSAMRLGTSASTPVDADDLHASHEDLDLNVFDLCDVLEAIHRDRVWVPGARGPLPVGWCMIHRWAWDHMTQIMERDWRDNLTLACVKSQGVTYYQAMLEKHAEIQGEEEDSMVRIMAKYGRRDLVEWDNTFAVFSSSASSLDHYGTLSGIRDYDHVLWKLAEACVPVDDPRVQQVIHALSEFLVFKNNMMVLRKFWSPQPGKGGQITAYESHLALHELCVVKIKERMQQWADDYGDEEEA